MEIPIEFTCPICREIAIDPQVLSCNHMVCDPCCCTLMYTHSPCVRCMDSPTGSILDISVRNYLQNVYSHECEAKRHRTWKGWRIDFVSALWKASLPALIERLDKFFPITTQSSAEFLKGTNINTLITAKCTDSNHPFQVLSDVDDSSVVAVLRKTGYVFIICTRDDVFLKGRYSAD